ncbi:MULTISPECIES: site-2 protease family protein [unclassified Halobacteriovorax]|uniref:Site-2 protease family protein n=1 Tax=Halobacteriovorax vibrionivorans TaxID=2152716 RepID=A0ABY0IGI7_9BACT|nr:site-2 protease family protein [Halobacteriovorax sp. BALOs_7]RZF22071.1 site-2 protease family protein [Halobacteriovorax vibrionivorans]TGD46968.1 site-2 protease family protein [Halobacteriovorax sp. Y22]
MDLMQIINKLTLALPGFLLAISFHEFGHGWMAKRYGDDTADRLGRLTLNPAPHIDLVGTVIFPLVAIFAGWIPFGWAKPVPVDVRRFKNIKSGLFWVSFAGPGANLLLMVFSALLFGMVYAYVPATFSLKSQFIQMLEYSVMINVVLAVFNLIPFPPLDGSKMVAAYLDYNTARKYEELQRFSFVFILVLWFTPILGYVIRPVMGLGLILMNGFAAILS